MSSFDIVSEVDTQEVTNAVDQSNREIGSRFDFRGVEAASTTSMVVFVYQPMLKYKLIR